MDFSNSNAFVRIRTLKTYRFTSYVFWALNDSGVWQPCRAYAGNGITYERLFVRVSDCRMMFSTPNRRRRNLGLCVHKPKSAYTRRLFKKYDNNRYTSPSSLFLTRKIIRSACTCRMLTRRIPDQITKSAFVRTAYAAEPEEKKIPPNIYCRRWPRCTKQSYPIVSMLQHNNVCFIHEAGPSGRRRNNGNNKTPVWKTSTTAVR